MAASWTHRVNIARSAGNPYDIIGAPRGAPKDEVRRLFRKLTVVKHPDVNPNNQIAAKEFADLVGAYNTIMGDEYSKTQLADELEQIRTEARMQYEKNLKKELKDGQVGMYIYRVLELCAGFFLLWTTTQGPEVLDKLGILPTNCDVNGKCYPVNILPTDSSASSVTSRVRVGQP